MKPFLAIGLSLALVIGAAACGGGGDGGDQQQASATGQQAAGQQPEVSVSDSTLISFVDASLALEDFRQEMRSRMQEASGREEGMKVRKRLMQERDSIIEAAGLSGTARYDTIMQAIKTNERLRTRYMSVRDSIEADSASSDTTS